MFWSRSHGIEGNYWASEEVQPSRWPFAALERDHNIGRQGQKLEPTNHTVRIHMRHVLVSKDSIVFRGDVIGELVVQNKTK